jgi:uncharacterized membrane-anchored protein YitT (DUF2179 family)
MATDTGATPASDPRHSLAEDVYAILIGSAFCGFGVVMLREAGLVTGGVAGLALIASYLSGLSVGLLFSLFNLPFLLLAYVTLGARFALKSAITIALLSGITLAVPHLMQMQDVDPWFAAIFGGTLIGMGIMALARHKSSVGGTGVLALYLYEKRGINAGKVQAGIDTVIVALSLVAIDPSHVLPSVVSVTALCAVLYAYHKPGRYTGY